MLNRLNFLLISNAYLFPLLFFSLLILNICSYSLKESIKRHVTLTRAALTSMPVIPCRVDVPSKTLKKSFGRDCERSLSVQVF